MIKRSRFTEAFVRGKCARVWYTTRYLGRAQDLERLRQTTWLTNHVDYPYH